MAERLREAAPVAPPGEPIRVHRLPPAPDLPRRWEPRARGSDPAGAYVWRYREIPAHLMRGGKKIPNPELTAAVFVVHGMGEQLRLETAATLRDGFESVVDRLRTENEGEHVPAPFTYEGYWANYEDLAATFPEEWASFNDRERELFSRLWERRSSSPARTALWLAGQSFRLLSFRTLRSVGPLRYATYLGVVPLTLVTLLGFYVRKRRVLGEVLADVRMYLRPDGDIERAIVQRIDRRVGMEFLRLLGLDWDLGTLDAHDRLTIGGVPQTFSSVTWVAHSLGSVVSFNVISDLLHRCVAVREECERGVRPERLENVKTLEDGLHRFVTIGSPLGKIAFLYPDVLRPWPAEYANGIGREGRQWWTNFWHAWDPVSGILDGALFDACRNEHSKLWRVPGVAHVSYWSDIPIMSYVVSRTYGKDVVEYRTPPFMRPTTATLVRLATLVGVPLVVAGAWLARGSWWPLVRHAVGF